MNIETMINFFSFSAWIFYGACFLAVIVLRFTKRKAERPFKVDAHSKSITLGSFQLSHSTGVDHHPHHSHHSQRVPGPCPNHSEPNHRVHVCPGIRPARTRSLLPLWLFRNEHPWHGLLQPMLPRLVWTGAKSRCQGHHFKWRQQCASGNHLNIYHEH